MGSEKTIFIIGGSGFLGSHLALKLRDHAKVFATYHRNPIRIPGVTTIPMDLGNLDWIKRAIYSSGPDAVVYAAGSNSLSAAEADPKEGEHLQVACLGPVLKAATIFQPRFIYFSSCYAFDGSRGNYRETDAILSPTTLGKLKISAENFVRGRALNYSILRLSPVYGRGNGHACSFLDHLRIRLGRKLKTAVDSTEIHSFTPIDAVTDLVQRIIENGPRNEIHHLGGLTKCTYLELAQNFAEKIGADPALIVPLAAERASTHGLDQTRFDFSLNSSETMHTFQLAPPLLDDGLAALRGPGPSP